MNTYKASSWTYWVWGKTFYLGAVFRHRKKVKLYGREVHLVGSYGVLNPAHGVADLGAHARLALQSAAVAPGDNALQLFVADHGATGVTLSKREKPLRTLSHAQMGKVSMSLHYPGAISSGCWSCVKPLLSPLEI